MNDYIKLFETHDEYQTYVNSEELVLPNVSYCIDANDVHYNPKSYYTVKITYTIPSPSTFNETHWDSQSRQMVVDVEYTEYDLLLINDDIDFNKIVINGVSQTTNTYHITESDTGTEIDAYIYMNTTIIPNNAFTGLFYVTGVEFGPQVLEIEDVPVGSNPLNEYNPGGAFANCSLNNIVLNNVKRIGHCAFKVSSRIDKYNYIPYKKYSTNEIVNPTKTAIPLDLSNVEYIGDFALTGLAISGDIILKDNITVCRNAFYETLIQGSITFPESYTSIDLSISQYYGYNSNTIIDSGLQNAIDGSEVFLFGNNVNEIVSFGNFGAQRLETFGIFKIPETVTQITGDYALKEHTELISLPTTPPTLSTNALRNWKQWNSSTRTYSYVASWSNIYVPDDSVNAYKTAPVWSTVASVIKPISQLS